jgi:hypothetical protein
MLTTTGQLPPQEVLHQLRTIMKLNLSVVLPTTGKRMLVAQLWLVVLILLSKKNLPVQ